MPLRPGGRHRPPTRGSARACSVCTILRVAREAARDEVDATFDVLDVSAPLRFPAASLGGVLAILVLQPLPHPAAVIAEIRRCLRPGGHLLITAPARDSTSITSQNLYWRLRAACYQFVPGVVRFYDTNSLPRLVEDQGLTVVDCNGEPGRVSVLARAWRRSSKVPSNAGSPAVPPTTRLLPRRSVVEVWSRISIRNPRMRKRPPCGRQREVTAWD